MSAWGWVILLIGLIWLLDHGAKLSQYEDEIRILKRDLSLLRIKVADNERIFKAKRNRGKGRKPDKAK